MSNFRKCVLLFLLCHFSLYGGFLVVTYIIDPFCIWHKPWFKNHRFFNDQMMNFGIANTLLKDTKYDTVIGVSSHFKDVPLEKYDRSLNFYVSSGSYLDFEFLLKKVLALKNIKNVVYGFELFWADPNLRKPYLNKNDLVLRNFRFIFKEIFSKKGTTNILRWSNNWNEDVYQKAQKNFCKIAKDYKLYQNLEQQSITNDQKCVFKELIDNYIIPYVKMYQDKIFHFVIPPYSFIRFLMTERTMEYIYLQRLLVEKLSNFPNVKIYGFYDCNFVQNLANYYDPHHYTPYIIRYILHSIKNNLHRLTIKNLDVYEINLIKNLKTFKVKSSYGVMDKFEDIVNQEANKSNRM